jgi:hypothetical protein
MRTLHIFSYAGSGIPISKVVSVKTLPLVTPCGTAKDPVAYSVSVPFVSAQ